MTITIAAVSATHAEFACSACPWWSLVVRRGGRGGAPDAIDTALGHQREVHGATPLALAAIRDRRYL